MKLYTWIKQARLTLPKVAFALGVNKSYIHKITKGSRKPSKDFLDKVRRLTSNTVTTFEDLIGKEETTNHQILDSLPSSRRQID